MPVVTDAFGYAYKYATKPNGETYTLPADPNTDSRFDTDQEVIANGDGTFRFENDDNVQFSILTSALFNEDDIIDNHGDLDIDEGGRGHMMNVKDWRDVEITFHFTVTDYSNEDGMYIVLGGGRHANPQPFCEGCGYIWKMFYNGDTQFLKEQWHNYKNPIPDDIIDAMQDEGADWLNNEGIAEGHLADFRGSWMLLKVVRYNVSQNDGTTAVKLEIYLNENGDKVTWTLGAELTDFSGWGNEGEECEGKEDQVLNWAYPMVRFTWENAERIDWYGLTIREIVPTAPVPTNGGGGNGGGGGEPPPPVIPPPEQPTGKVAKMASFRFSIASTLATSCDGVEPQQPSTNPNPPPDTGQNPPPAQAGTISFQFAEYFRVGS